MKLAVSSLRRARALLLGLAAFGAAQGIGRADEPALEKGRVVRALPTREDPLQTYAYYLPSGYDPSRRWPILYCFDPGARGWLPVELFAEAAEQRGYLVVGSNNSRNGPPAVSNAAAVAIWQDTQARLAIDGARVYATGFSGGSRVASQFAQSLGIAGVIGAGAGFGTGVSPSTRVSFAYFGVVGRDDFNFFELTALTNDLAKAGVPTHLEIFEGPHDWPPPEVAARALEWMDVRAMRTRAMPADAARIERFAAEARARLAREAAGSYERYRLLRTTLDDLRGLSGVADLEGELLALSASKAIEKAAQAERRQREQQADTIALLLRLEATTESLSPPPALGSDTPEFEPTFAARRELEDRLGSLVAKATASQPGEKRTLARRTLYGFSVICWQNALEAHGAKKLDLALAHSTWVAASRPDAAWPRLQLAALAAEKGDTRRALRHLGEAIDRGYSDVSALETDEDFAALRRSPGFAKLVERARAARR